MFTTSTLILKPRGNPISVAGFIKEAGLPYTLHIDMHNFLERLRGSLLPLKREVISLPFSIKKDCWNIFVLCQDLILQFSM